MPRFRPGSVKDSALRKRRSAHLAADDDGLVLVGAHAEQLGVERAEHLFPAVLAVLGGPTAHADARAIAHAHTGTEASFRNYYKAKH